jgi:cytidine deaminase
MTSDRSRLEWDALRAAARDAAAFAPASYSHLKVNAAGFSLSGEIFSRCNVENVSYGLTLGAERGRVSAARRAGHAAQRRADRLVRLHLRG